MNKKLLYSLGALAVVSLTVILLVKAQAAEPAATQRYECAMIKWDGPDKVALIYPDHSEVVRVFKSAKLPADVTEEEFCLTWGANKLALEGWEPVNLNSRRVLFRRPAPH
jgi:hypothetical protein